MKGGESSPPSPLRIGLFGGEIEASGKLALRIPPPPFLLPGMEYKGGGGREEERRKRGGFFELGWREKGEGKSGVVGPAGREFKSGLTYSHRC